MATYAIEVRIHRADPDETGFWAEVPSLPGCFSQGESYEETLANIQEAVQAYVEASVRRGEKIPLAANQPEQVSIPVSVALVA